MNEIPSVIIKVTLLVFPLQQNFWRFGEDSKKTTKKGYSSIVSTARERECEYKKL